MTPSLNQLMEALEHRKKQLDEVLESYKQFREKLDALPTEIAEEARGLLAANGPPETARGRTVLTALCKGRKTDSTPVLASLN